MAKTQALALPVQLDDDERAKPTEDVYFLALPVPTLRAMSDAAAARGMTLAQAVSTAWADFIAATPKKR